MSNRCRLFIMVFFFLISSVTHAATLIATENSIPESSNTDTGPPPEINPNNVPAYAKQPNPQDSSIPAYATHQALTDPTAIHTSLADKNYMLLQVELARYQLAAQNPWPTITLNRKLKLGSKAPVVELLRERLKATGDFHNTTVVNPLLYDVALKEAVKRFQARHGLKDDGIVGPATLAELNISPLDRIKAISINMQRWANLSGHLGNRFIMVNIPDFTLHLYENNEEVLSMKAIVGKPDWETPELSSRITRVILNPYWNVPDTIAAKDLAPKVRNDPYYLQDMHIKVFIRNGSHSRQVDDSDIDWEKVSGDDSLYDFRQEPGDDNALGLVKFEFPNPYNVYLHDTPVKELFDQPMRDLSHGCVRLERPLDLLNYLMKDDPTWDTYRIQETLDMHQTTEVPVRKPIPIFITYITVWTDPDGVVNYRDDIYKHDI